MTPNNKFKLKSKRKILKNNDINTSVFLQTEEITEVNMLSNQIDIIGEDRELELINSKYIDLKSKINLLLSKKK
jgi:hypothetical protein